jgi:hypothetical protein
VVVTTTGFSQLARLTGKSGGVDDLNVAEYPGPLGMHAEGEIARNIETVLIDRIVSGLTRPGAQAAPATVRSGDPRQIVFSGTAAEVNDYFIKQ